MSIDLLKETGYALMKDKELHLFPVLSGIPICAIPVLEKQVATRLLRNYSGCYGRRTLLPSLEKWITGSPPLKGSSLVISHWGWVIFCL
jgi:hypothetical protein